MFINLAPTLTQPLTHTLIRLAWHASGTYSAHSKTGGSSGAGMRFAPEAEWGANAGLKGTRDFLESIKKKHGLSYGDTWTLAGVTAVEMMGGPGTLKYIRISQ
jgi:cytochrome c peroxidase